MNKDISTMGESSYNPGAFTIELAAEWWPIAHDYAFSDHNARRALLHEYTHYLQDTVTWYGIRYREELYYHRIDRTIAGGGASSNLGLPCFGFDEYAFDTNGRPMFGGDLIGAVAVKENMARQAEFYVFGKPNFDNSTAVIYTGVTHFVSCFSRKIANSPLALYVLDDCCLGTSDPIMSMLTLLKQMDAEVVEEHLVNTDTAMSHWLYSYCHELLAKERITVDEEVDGSVFDLCEWQIAMLNNVSYQLYEKEEDGKANIEYLADLCDKLERCNRVNATLRPNNHTILADAMIAFKQNNDFPMLFEQFGTPLIKQAGTKDVHLSNVDVLMPKNERVRELS
jgi:hypothetical protein